VLLILSLGCCGSSKQTADAAVDAATEARLEVGPEVSPMMAAAALEGLRWTLPCSNNGNGYCDTPAADTKSATLSGNAGVTYDITLRFRGVVEEKTYLYGTAEGHWQIGGIPNEDLYNVYKLEVAAPAQTYYLNAGQTGLHEDDPGEGGNRGVAQRGLDRQRPGRQPQRPGRPDRGAGHSPRARRV
jgi:hypothetical protein